MLTLTRKLDQQDRKIHSENLLRLDWGRASAAYGKELKKLSAEDLKAVDEAITAAHDDRDISGRAQLIKHATDSLPSHDHPGPKPWYTNEKIYSDPLDPWRACAQALDLARKGDPDAIHRMFLSDYVRESEPFLGGEDLETMAADHEDLLNTIGDKKFADALVLERPEVVAAVGKQFNAWQMSRSNFAEHYPLTSKALSRAPRIDFQIDQAAREKGALLERIQEFEEAQETTQKSP
jgi:hypothetical protein